MEQELKSDFSLQSFLLVTENKFGFIRFTKPTVLLYCFAVWLGCDRSLTSLWLLSSSNFPCSENFLLWILPLILIYYYYFLLLFRLLSWFITRRTTVSVHSNLWSISQFQLNSWKVTNSKNKEVRKDFVEMGTKLRSLIIPCKIKSAIWTSILLGIRDPKLKICGEGRKQDRPFQCSNPM